MSENRPKERSDPTDSQDGTFQKPVGYLPENSEEEGLRIREWALALCEFCLGYAWQSLMGRATSEETLEKRGIDCREETLESLYWSGWAAIGALVVGHLADSYVTCHWVAVANVVLQLVLATLVLLSDVVNESAIEDEYGLLLTHLFLWSFIPIKSTSFARLTYALEQLPYKKHSKIFFFLFVFMFSGALGRYVNLHVSHYTVSVHSVSTTAVLMNCVALLVYLYIARPPLRLYSQFRRGISLKLFGCIGVALIGRLRGRRTRRASWLDYAEHHYGKTYVAMTKSVLKLFLTTLPSIGFLMFTSSNERFFAVFWSSLRVTNSSAATLLWIQASSLVTMVFMELVAVPILRRCTHNVNFLKRFIIGNVALLLAMYYVTLVMTVTEKTQGGMQNGLLRVFNTGNHEVHFTPQDNLTKLHYSVEPNNYVLARYQAKRPFLFKMLLSAEDYTYTIHMSVTPNEETGYVIVNPGILYRIGSYIPINEAPPGKNHPFMARCFLANMIKQEKDSITLVNRDTGSAMSVSAKPGTLEVFQVNVGQYTVLIDSTTVNLKTEIHLGAVYGFYMFNDFFDYRLVVDQVMVENTNSVWLGLGITVPMGIAYGLGYVALPALVFTTAPAGLKGISMSLLQFLEQITSWLFYIGYYTWHTRLTAQSYAVYSVLESVFFILCLLLLMKYRKFYTI